MPTRREFMKSLGIALGAGLIGGRFDMRSALAGVGEGKGPFGHASWKDLQKCWFELEAVVEATMSPDWESEEDVTGPFKERHRKALDKLVQANELNAEVAGRIHEAHEDAVFHLYRSNGRMSCYDPTSQGVVMMQARQQLVDRVELLEQMAHKGEIDKDAVDKARKALELDIALYDALAEVDKLGNEERWQEWNRVVDAYEAKTLEVDKFDAEAADILVGLLTASDA